MRGQEVIYSSIEVDDNVKTASLGVLDQIKLIVKFFSNHDDAELDTENRLSQDKLNKLAALRNFFEKAIAKMQSLGEQSVTIKFSNEFLPFIDEVVDKEHGYGRFYDIHVNKGSLNSVSSRYFIVKISTKVDDNSIGGV